MMKIKIILYENTQNTLINTTTPNNNKKISLNFLIAKDNMGNLKLDFTNH